MNNIHIFDSHREILQKMLKTPFETILVSFPSNVLLFLVLCNVEWFNYAYSQFELYIDRGKEKEEKVNGRRSN